MVHLKFHILLSAKSLRFDVFEPHYAVFFVLLSSCKDKVQTENETLDVYVVVLEVISFISFKNKVLLKLEGNEQIITFGML